MERLLWPYFILTFLFIQTSLFSQEALIDLSFSKGDQAQNKALIKSEEATYSLGLMRQSFSEGLNDYALDLSEKAMYRRPWIIDSLLAKKIQADGSFSVQVWVKTLTGAEQGTPIIGNKKSEDESSVGWQIGSQENGAWSLQLSDGQDQYRYSPTQRQEINDGKWHQIVFSVERPKNEARMYFDGKAVAIYNLGELGDLTSSKRTVVGGSDEYFEWGSAGQWKAFNGYLDEVKIWNRVISRKEVQTAWAAFFPNQSPKLQEKVSQQLKVMAWNIWHGGRRYGEKVGLKRTIECIKASNADIVGLIETYGSGEKIADALGYEFYLISSNLSIMSRYPITKSIEAFRAFNFGGAEVEIGEGKRLLVLNTWLHYLPDYLKSVNEGKLSAEELIVAEGETRFAEISSILAEMKPHLNLDTYLGILMSGDFNSGSHLDWIPLTQNIHQNYVVKWPESEAMLEAGFKDSFRELHINPAMDPGYTWTPRAATSSNKYGMRDRIDYIYYQGKGMQAIYSEVLDYHPIMFPSDHAAVISVFRLE
ncbi:MAG: LamG-like jellyroll fold domain-containing protein [Bacteroidota bacterium]